MTTNYSIDPSTLILHRGAHTAEQMARGKVCAVEAASVIAGPPSGVPDWEPSDHDPRFSEVIAAILRRWNDQASDADRQVLVPYLTRLDGTAGSVEQEDRRRWMCADWATRTALPMWLRTASRGEMADEMAALPEITDWAVWDAQRASIIAVREACWQARSVWLDEIRAKVRASAVDVAVADAAADAVAADVAAAVAADVDVAAAVAAAVAADVAVDVVVDVAAAAAADVDVAAAVAAAVAADAAAAADGWGAVYRATYNTLREQWTNLPVIRETADAVQASAFDLLDRLIAVTAITENPKIEESK